MKKGAVKAVHKMITKEAIGFKNIGLDDCTVTIDDVQINVLRILSLFDALIASDKQTLKSAKRYIKPKVIVRYLNKFRRQDPVQINSLCVDDIIRELGLLTYNEWNELIETLFIDNIENKDTQGLASVSILASTSLRVKTTYVNIWTAMCLCIKYWLNKIDTRKDYTDGFDTFCKNTVGDDLFEHYVDLCKNLGRDDLNEYYYSNLDKYIELAELSYSEDKLREHLDYLDKYTFHNGKHFCDYISDEVIKKCAYVLVLCSVHDNPAIKELSTASTLVYLLSSHKQGNIEIHNYYEFIEQVKDIAYARISNKIQLFNTFLCYSYSKLHEEMANNTDYTNRVKGQVGKLEEKVSGLKKERRDTAKKLKEAEGKIQKLQLDSNKIQALEDEKQLKCEIERLTKELGALQSKLDGTLKELDTASRELRSKDKEIEQLDSELKAAIDSANAANNRALSLEQQAQISEVKSALASINTSCFINAIMDKRVGIVGGDMLYSKIFSYGLNNFRTFEAGKKKFLSSDVAGLDLIVIVTSFIDHTSVAAISGLARNNGIDIVYFNNKNVDMLVYKVFEYFYS